MTNGPTKEAVLAECYQYSNTANLFYVLYQHLKAMGITAEIEHDFTTPSGGKRNPDFAILDGNTLTDVLEHKASLPTPQHALSEVKRVAIKYKTLVYQGVVSTPKVILLYPREKQGVVDQIDKKIPPAVTLCSFDQASSDTKIWFKLQGPTNSNALKQVIGGQPLDYDPALVRSTYKFIRADPPPTYTAFRVWGIFPTFLDIKSSGARSYLVKRDALIQRMAVFHPPWIRNNNQITSDRVGNALAFLARIDFVDWEPGERDIWVNASRGTRAGDLLQYFSEKWSKLHQRKRRKRVGAKPTTQLQLTEFE